MFCMRMGHIPQPVRAYGGSLLDRLPRLSPAFARAVVLRRRAGVHVLRIGQSEGFGVEGRPRSCVPPSRQRAGQGCPCLARVSRGRACVGAGGRIAAARLARLIARARRRTHLARPFPPGCFSRPPAIAFCRKAERRPRKPPLSTFILHHMGESQAHPGTKSEYARYLSRNAGGNEPESMPALSSRHASPRHARTCSGHPLSPLTRDGRMDARNKSGHDGGGAFRRDGKQGDRRRCARPKFRPASSNG